jgi:hypothetical protein
MSTYYLQDVEYYDLMITQGLREERQMPNITNDFEIKVIETVTIVRTVYMPVAGSDYDDALNRAWYKAEGGEFDSHLYYEKPVITDVDREYLVS